MTDSLPLHQAAMSSNVAPMSSNDVLQNIKYETIADGSERAVSPLKQIEYDDDAQWSWEAQQELHRHMDNSETDFSQPLMMDDRQSGAASPLVEPSQLGLRHDDFHLNGRTLLQAFANKTGL